MDDHKSDGRRTIVAERLACCAGELSTLGVSRFAKRYPAVLTALIKSLLEVICKYERAVAG